MANRMLSHVRKFTKGQKAEQRREWNMMERVMTAIGGIFKGRSSGRGE